MMSHYDGMRISSASKPNVESCCITSEAQAQVKGKNGAVDHNNEGDDIDNGC